MRGRSFGREFPEPAPRPFHSAWRATVPRSICVASDILSYRASGALSFSVKKLCNWGIFGRYAEGVRDLSPGWSEAVSEAVSEAEPWVLI